MLERTSSGTLRGEVWLDLSPSGRDAEKEHYREMLGDGSLGKRTLFEVAENSSWLAHVPYHTSNAQEPEVPADLRQPLSARAARHAIALFDRAFDRVGVEAKDASELHADAGSLSLEERRDQINERSMTRLAQMFSPAEPFAHLVEQMQSSTVDLAAYVGYLEHVLREAWVVPGTYYTKPGRKGGFVAYLAAESGPYTWAECSLENQEGNPPKVVFQQFPPEPFLAEVSTLLGHPTGVSFRHLVTLTIAPLPDDSNSLRGSLRLELHSTENQQLDRELTEFLAAGRFGQWLGFTVDGAADSFAAFAYPYQGERFALDQGRAQRLGDEAATNLRSIHARLVALLEKKPPS